jgi:hypothetical protein
MSLLAFLARPQFYPKKPKSEPATSGIDQVSYDFFQCPKCKEKIDVTGIPSGFLVNCTNASCTNVTYLPTRSNNILFYITWAVTFFSGILTSFIGTFVYERWRRGLLLEQSQEVQDHSRIAVNSSAGEKMEE